MLESDTVTANHSVRSHVRIRCTMFYEILYIVHRTTLNLICRTTCFKSLRLSEVQRTYHKYSFKGSSVTSVYSFIIRMGSLEIFLVKHVCQPMSHLIITSIWLPFRPVTLLTLAIMTQHRLHPGRSTELCQMAVLLQSVSVPLQYSSF